MNLSSLLDEIQDLSDFLLPEQMKNSRSVLPTEKGDTFIDMYCDLRGRIKGNAEALYHVLLRACNNYHPQVLVNAIIHSACTVTNVYWCSL